MVTEQLKDYIHSQIQNGISEEAIRSSLVKRGWSEQDISQAFVSQGMPQENSTISNPSKNVYPNESTTLGKTIITILALIFFYPIGLLLMWGWSKWPKWLKILITLPILILIIIAILGILASILLVAINPKSQIEKARCTKECSSSQNVESCISNCTSIKATANPNPKNQQNKASAAPSSATKLIPTNSDLKTIQSDLMSTFPNFNFNLNYGEYNPPLTLGTNVISSYLKVEIMSEKTVEKTDVSRVGKKVCNSLEKLQIEVSSVDVGTASKGAGGTCKEWKSGKMD